MDPQYCGYELSGTYGPLIRWTLYMSFVLVFADACSRFRMAEYSQNFLHGSMIGNVTYLASAFQSMYSAKVNGVVELDVLGVWPFLIFDLLLIMPFSFLIIAIHPDRSNLMHGAILLTAAKVVALSCNVWTIFHPAIVAANCEKLRSPGHKLGDAVLTEQNFENVKLFYLIISVVVLVMVLVVCLVVIGLIRRPRSSLSFRLQGVTLSRLLEEYIIYLIMVFVVGLATIALTEATLGMKAKFTWGFNDIAQWGTPVIFVFTYLAFTFLGQIGRQKIKSEWRGVFEMKPKAPNTGNNSMLEELLNDPEWTRAPPGSLELPVPRPFPEPSPSRANMAYRRPRRQERFLELT